MSENDELRKKNTQVFQSTETTPTFPDNTQNITEVHKTVMKNSGGGKLDAFVCYSVRLQRGHRTHVAPTRPWSSDQTDGAINSP